jgi:hypothetical protein
MDVGAASVVLVLVYIVVVVAVIALPVWVLREMRRRGEQLDRMERRLNDLDRHRGGDSRPD